MIKKRIEKQRFKKFCGWAYVCFKKGKSDLKNGVYGVTYCDCSDVVLIQPMSDYMYASENVMQVRTCFLRSATGNEVRSGVNLR